MAQVIWTEPALEQLDEIAEYIALDNQAAATELVRRVFETVDRLERFPDSGREPPELSDSVYREVVCSPCRVFYRQELSIVLILYVMREEMQLRKYMLHEPHGAWEQSFASMAAHGDDRLLDPDMVESDGDPQRQWE